MAIDKINLRKLLQLFCADSRFERSLILKDIREDKKKATKEPGGGGDFYGPFWFDAINHAAGRSDIVEQTAIRIADNKSRERLYPILRDSFLNMWNEKMRWRNEPFEFVPERVKAQLHIKPLNAVVKIENTAAVKTWDGSHRVIYPYFSEVPTLSEDGARLGFWALKAALPEYRAEDFRIVDMQHRTYFRPAEVGTKGDEEKQFILKYDAVLKLWRKLKNERK